MRKLNYGKAIHEALVQEMALDSSVFVMGQGVDDGKGHYGSTLDLHKIYGADRSFDTPISEDSMTGVAVGAALAGQRPVYVHQRMDFLTLAMNQLVNMAAKYPYMSGGTVSVPIVIRASIGRSWGQGPQHSQAFYPFFMHIPGLKVIAPTTPHDVKGGLIASIRDNSPVVFIEHRLLYGVEGYVSEEPYEIDISKSRVLKKGKDITLVGVSYTSIECMRAAVVLEQIGLNVEVIDLLSLSPLDFQTIFESTAKTGTLLFVDNTWTTCAAGSEVLARLMESPIAKEVKASRMGFANTTCPTTRCLEDAFYPDAKKIVTKVQEMLSMADKELSFESVDEALESFRGPF